MAERLGIVLYWIGCFLAAGWVLIYGGVFLALAFESGYFTEPMPMLVMTFLPAISLWLLGRGLRYIFSGY